MSQKGEKVHFPDKKKIFDAKSPFFLPHGVIFFSFPSHYLLSLSFFLSFFLILGAVLLFSLSSFLYLYLLFPPSLPLFSLKVEWQFHLVCQKIKRRFGRAFLDAISHATNFPPFCVRERERKHATRKRHRDRDKERQTEGLTETEIDNNRTRQT